MNNICTNIIYKERKQINISCKVKRKRKSVYRVKIIFASDLPFLVMK